MSGSNGRACFLAAVVFCVVPAFLWGYTVSVGSVVADSGEEVRVPVSLDTVKGVMRMLLGTVRLIFWAFSVCRF